MKRFLVIVFVAGLFSCDNSSKLEKELDSAKQKIDTALNSRTADSIKAKGKRILDSVEGKGGKLIDRAKEEFEDLKKKDSTNN